MLDKTMCYEGDKCCSCPYISFDHGSERVVVLCVLPASCLSSGPSLVGLGNIVSCGGF
jgi:hypothetical protein